MREPATKTGSTRLGTVALLVALACCGTGDFFAQGGRLRVLASAGVRAAVDDLHARLERTTGSPFDVEFSTTSAIKQRIEAGEGFDVAILTSDAIDELTEKGKILADSRARLGRSGIGVGVRKGAPGPDVSTPEAIRNALLRAKSLTWVQPGASRVHVDAMLEALGIADKVKSKVLLTQGVEQSIASVAEGKSELVISLISEILPAQGVELVGPIPGRFQYYVELDAGVGVSSQKAAAAAALVRALASPAAAQTYRANGLDPF